MKVQRIIMRYLELNPGTRVANHIFQTIVPQFGQNVYGVLHSPDIYSRAWRDLRKDNGAKLRQYGYTVIEVEVNNSKEKHFLVRKLNEVHRDSQGCSEQTGDNNSAGGVKETPAT